MARPSPSPKGAHLGVGGRTAGVLLAPPQFCEIDDLIAPPQLAVSPRSPLPGQRPFAPRRPPMRGATVPRNNVSGSQLSLTGTCLSKGPRVLISPALRFSAGLLKRSTSFRQSRRALTNPPGLRLFRAGRYPTLPAMVDDGPSAIDDRRRGRTTAGSPRPPEMQGRCIEGSRAAPNGQ